MESAEDLQKEAQGKLAEARRLIKEAGVLAEKGNFHLYFGEIGSYYPKSMFDDERWEAEALAIAKAEGRTDYGEYNYRTNSYEFGPDGRKTAFDDLTTHEQDNLVHEIANELKSEAFGDCDAAEYASPGWWHPSRC